MPITAAPPDPIAAALWFLERGFSVFPCFYPKTSIVCSCGLGARCPQPGKHPATVGGFKDATTDAEMVKTFLKNPGTRNYGLVCPEGVIAVDVDGEDGKAAWDDLQKTLGPLPLTLTTRTANGFHFFFKVPPSVPGGKMFGFVVRDSHSGYVIGPGSKHASGVYYKANRGADGQPLPIQPLPEAWVMGWLLDRAEPGVGGPLITVHGDSATYAAPASVAEGGRYDEIVRYTAHLHNTGISREEQFALVESVLNPRFHPPLAPDELRSRFDRATRGMEARLGPPISPRSRVDDAPIVIEKPDDDEIIDIGIEDYRASIPDHIDWISPLAALGSVTVVAAPAKSGKSTLIAGLLRARETGETFLGMPVPVGPTLLLTEEGGFAVGRKTEGLSSLRVIDRKRAVTKKLSFAKVLGAVEAWAERNPGQPLLAVIDTLAIWAEVKDENDAAGMTRAISPIMALAQVLNIAIIVIHHGRKGGGEYGEAIRGSSAILATVDHVVEVRRGRGDLRLLDIYGRLSYPARLTVDFDRDSLDYTIVDNEDDEGPMDEMLAKVPADGDGLTLDDLGIVWKRADPRKIARGYIEAGRLIKRRGEPTPGAGRPRDRYWSVPPPTIVFSRPVEDGEPDPVERDSRSVSARMESIFGDEVG